MTTPTPDKMRIAAEVLRASESGRWAPLPNISEVAAMLDAAADEMEKLRQSCDEAQDEIDRHEAECEEACQRADAAEAKLDHIMKTTKPKMGEPGWSTATDAPPGVEG